MQHLDDHQLQSWLDRGRSGISQAEAAEVETHVAGCETCEARLAELEATSRRTRSLLAFAAPASEGPPDFRDVVRRSRQRAPSGGGGRWWMAAGWAASLVVATGLGWLSHDLLRPGTDAGSPTAFAEAQRVVPRSVEVEPGEAASADEAGADVSGPDEERTATPPPPTEEAGRQAIRFYTMPQPPDTGGAQDSAAVADPDPEITVAPTTFADAAARHRLGAEPGSPRIQGQVRAEDGSPLAGAQVMIQGSTLGTVTGSDGTFSLPVPAEAIAADSVRPLTLTAQFLGFRNASRYLDPRAAGTASVDFQLEKATLALDEAAVTSIPSEALATRTAPAARLRGGVADEPREVWTPVNRTLAESQVGFAVLIVPELAVVEIELGEILGVVAVKVRQALDSGATLTLVQQISDGPVAEPTLPADQPAETVERDGLRITGSAPIALDSLRVLLDRVR